MSAVGFRAVEGAAGLEPVPYSVLLGWSLHGHTEGPWG